MVSSGSASDNPRFIPGDVIAGRYRIAGLLGRGGMGEVYRADDLRLHQPVALKFLAEPSGAALARFHREVSIARQISHRHVCRVYDIGEHAGLHFLSMEYTRGEELGSLLKRIGRLPADKALAVARQLCAGLAAIHAAGVLHRDLKPGNIMIDEHGDVRITDFGIAALSEGVSGAEAMIGTPAYMSPEQRAGGELTTRSDLYALGLVLHEFFTGRRPPEGPSGTTTVPDVDPLVERVILRCLEPDPARRPASALQVAAALPGGDPLAAALAAGETPSPQMVAAAPKEGSLRPAIATMLLLSIVVGIVLIAVLSDRTSLHRLVPLPRSPEVLRENAVSLARAAGYAAATDAEDGFAIDEEALAHVQRHDRSADRWQRMRRGDPPVVGFWYRQSPRPLEARGGSRVQPHDPPNTLAGMVMLQLDTTGRLLYFEGVPPQVDAKAPARPADWTPFFAAAGLDARAFRETGSRWRPPQHSDARVAWQTARGDLRIEAAAYRGSPTYFEVIAPWREPSRQPLPFHAERAFPILMLVLYFGAIVLASLLAWRNLRQGRGDRRGTFRLAVFTFALRMIYWLFHAHHTATAGEVTQRLIDGLQSALYWTALIALLHLALEPFVRRRWPEWIISWSRLLAGDLRDPLVGRDVLIGCAFGVAIILSSQLFPILPANNSPLVIQLGLEGARGFIALLVNQISASILFSFIVVSLLLFFAMLTRRNAVAIGLTWLLIYAALGLSGPPTLVRLFLHLLVPTLLITVIARYGVLALMTAFFFTHLWAFYPVTTEVTAWYATSANLQVLLLIGIAVYGFRTSLAGQRLVRADLFD
ncbi:MAG TPA: serine/threonine-protein kinase [Thermoanaerobaculia bacterium]